MLTDPRTILNGFKTAIAAIKLPGTDPAAAAFERVEIYDLEDLFQAIEELLAFKHRLALVLLEDVANETTLAGRVLFVRRTVNVTVLLADRDWSNRREAMMGNNAGTAGAIALADLLLETLAGEQPGGLIVEPGMGELFALAGPARDNAPGRIAWRQEFRVSGGTLKRSLSREAR